MPTPLPLLHQAEVLPELPPSAPLPAPPPVPLVLPPPAHVAPVAHRLQVSVAPAAQRLQRLVRTKGGPRRLPATVCPRDCKPSSPSEGQTPNGGINSTTRCQEITTRRPKPSTHEQLRCAGISPARPIDIPACCCCCCISTGAARADDVSKQDTTRNKPTSRAPQQRGAHVSCTHRPATRRHEARARKTDEALLRSPCTLESSR